jgi:hypothetical protein
MRWEAMHSIALITPNKPDMVIHHWDQLHNLFHHDKSVIVRDYIVLCAGNLAASEQIFAEKVYSFLIEALSAYQTHHAKLALEGLTKALSNLNSKRDEIAELAELLEQHPKPSIKKAALRLKKRLYEL